ncbi:non-SMC mitotic condensation complex subunit 1 [Lactifluus volemus]|nr:non-SMC mitotic condensation complex subunit 1 [Lactifluus volemus]
MASEFDLQEELQALQDSGNYSTHHEHRCNQEKAVRAIAESFKAITSPDTFDISCSFLKCVDAVPGILMSKLLDVIMSGFATEVDAAAHDIDHEDQQTCAARKIPMEMYAFLLNWLARSVEKVNVSDEDASAATVPTKSRKEQGRKATQSRVASKNKAAEWSWNDQIVPILTLITKVLKLKTDTFIGCCLTAPAYHVTENEQYMITTSTSPNPWQSALTCC